MTRKAKDLVLPDGTYRFIRVKVNRYVVHPRLGDTTRVCVIYAEDRYKALQSAAKFFDVDVSFVHCIQDGYIGLYSVNRNGYNMHVERLSANLKFDGKLHVDQGVALCSCCVGRNDKGKT